METKGVMSSKTLWFNVLSIIGLVLTEMLATPEFREAFGGNIVYLMIAGAFANVLLRFGTTTPVKVNPPKPPLNPVDQALADEAEENGMV